MSMNYSTTLRIDRNQFFDPAGLGIRAYSVMINGCSERASSRVAGHARVRPSRLLARFFLDYIARQSVVLPGQVEQTGPSLLVRFDLGPFAELRSQLAGSAPSVQSRSYLRSP